VFGDFAVGEPAIDHYVVTAASPQTAGTAFNTTVTAQDIFNQTVPDSATIVTLSSSTGNAQLDSNGDSMFGDNTKTLSNGAFTITTAGNKTLTASAPDLTSATSSSFTINPAPVSAVRVETAADGSGTVVPAQNLTAGNALTVYAITRDASGNFVANVAATAWSLPP